MVNDPHPPALPPTRPPGAGASADRVDPQTQALARAVDRVGRRLDGLDTLVAQLATDLATLARYVQTGTGTAHPTAHPSDAQDESAEVVPVRSWLLADDVEQAVADLADLCAWIDRVYLRYPHTELPSCWLWHPHAVEELWWLRRAHADAYHPQTGSWLRVGDWHDRQLPGLTRRLAQAIGSCELALHVTDVSSPARLTGTDSYVPRPSPAPLSWASGQVAAAWVADGSAPEPDPTQLAEADRISGRPAWSRR